MGPYNKFSIIDRINNNFDYSRLRSSMYDNLVTISDDCVCSWIEPLFEMPTFWHEMSRPNKGLTHYGITLIPPESLLAFREVVKRDIHINEVKKLLNLIDSAIKGDKFIIHFGI